MDRESRAVLKEWAELKARNALPKELQVEPSVLLQSEELRRRLESLVAEERTRSRQAEQIHQEIRARELPLQEKVDAALARVRVYAQQRAELPALAVGSFGAIGIDPKHLVIYVIVPRRSDVHRLQKSGLAKEIRERLLAELKAENYPLASLRSDVLGFYSQEECDEEAGGNWYHFFK